MERKVPVSPKEEMTIFSQRMNKFRVIFPKEILDAVFWVRSYNELLQKVVVSRSGIPQEIQLFNLTDQVKSVASFISIGYWIPEGNLPWEQRYVRLSSAKYRDWQVLFEEAQLSAQTISKIKQEQLKWEAEQPPAVQKPKYKTPRVILKKEIPEAPTSDQ